MDHKLQFLRLSGDSSDANSALRADFTLQIGQVLEKVTVASKPVRVETESTQMGDVITSKTITAVPLNGRLHRFARIMQVGARFSF